MASLEKAQIQKDLVHPLTPLDCDELFQIFNPTIGWVVKGENITLSHLSATLRKAIVRKMPWLAGRLVLRSGSPRYEIRVPALKKDHQPFGTTEYKDMTVDLQDLMPNYTPPGTPNPSIKPAELPDIACLQPLHHFNIPADQVAKESKPLLHLHLVRARDLFVICLAWRHVVMDAAAAGGLVAAWEEEIASASPTASTPSSNEKTPEGEDNDLVTMPPDLPSLIPFMEKAEKADTTMKFPGWCSLQPLAFIPFLIYIKYQRRKYPGSHRDIYLPKRVIKKWQDEVTKELEDTGRGDIKLSRNDIVSAWFYKTAYPSISPSPTSLTTLSRSVNLRFRHPSLPTALPGNLVGLSATAPLTTAALRKSSLATIALHSHESLRAFVSAPSRIESFVGFLARHYRTVALPMPGPSPFAKKCVVSSYVNLGLRSPNFGRVRVLAAMPLIMSETMATWIDDGDGGWRIHTYLPDVAWEEVRRALETEMK